MGATTGVGGVDREVDRVARMLKMEGSERILYLASDSEEHAAELGRRGHEVVWVKCSQDRLPSVDFDEEFDVVLGLDGGAVGHLDAEEESLQLIAAISRALRDGGQHLMRLPNLLYAEKHLPERTWTASGAAIEIVERRFDKRSRRLCGSTQLLREGQVFSCADRTDFRQRLYGVEEIDSMLRGAGMRVANVFRDNGRARVPDDTHPEIYVLGLKL